MATMEKIKVECLEKIDYGGGEGRLRPGFPVDYLYVTATLTGGEDVEYYAETIKLGPRGESYDTLVDDVYEQMLDDGLEVDKSVFYDF